MDDLLICFFGIQINVFFPRLMARQKNEGRKDNSVSFIKQYQIKFVDCILIPLVNTVIDTSAYSAPLSYHSAGRRGLNKISIKIDSSLFSLLLSKIEDFVSDKPSLEDFKNIFVVLYSHGMKKIIPREILRGGTLDVYRFCFETSLLGVHEDDFDTQNLYIDLAYNFVPLSEQILTGLWVDSDFLLSKFFKPAFPSNKYKGDLRLDSFCNFSGLGGFKYKENNKSVLSVQAYGVWKQPFFSRNYESSRQGKDLSPLDVYNHTWIFKAWVVL
jgi:hypothetical protein